MRALLKDQLCRKGACSGRSPPLTPQTVSPTDQCGLPPPYPASPSICRDSNLHPDLDKRVPFNFASGAMEIGQILQKSTAQSVPVKYFGISPPTRTGGAVNPLVQDNNWLEKARQCSHKNLQALKEIEEMSGVTFLHSSSCNGISGLFDVSPDDSGLLSKVDEDTEENAACNTTCLWPAGDGRAAKRDDVLLASDPCLSHGILASFHSQMTCEASVRPASSPLVRQRGFDIAAS
eukprot:jgi/Botrbrau1/12124/Bobra.0186s0041.1